MLSLSFPFMSFSVQGLTQEITLLNAAKMLEEFQNVLLAILLFSTVILLPALYLVIILFLYVKALRVKKHCPQHQNSGSPNICAICCLKYSLG